MPQSGAPVLSLILAVVTLAPGLLPQPPAAAEAPTARSAAVEPWAPAPGHLLVATRHLSDPNFRETVILLLACGPEGAMGLIVNRPSPITLGHAFPDVAALAARPDHVYLGGPVAPGQALLLSRAALDGEGAEKVVPGVWVVGAGRRELERAAAGAAPFRIYAGYAGWAPGQLEREIAMGSWHVTPADADTIFTPDPTTLWRQLEERSTASWAAARVAADAATG